MNGWQEDKRWSDRFLPEIKRILGEHLISEPPMEEDMQHNTDLIVLTLNSVRIACRVRKYKYLDKYGDQFTIRTGRPSDAKTELTKIMEGWGDYFFYGFANAQETALAQWVLGDLKAFRLFINRSLVRNKGRLPDSEHYNPDGSSTFRAFQHKDIQGFVITKSVLHECGAA